MKKFVIDLKLSLWLTDCALSVVHRPWLLLGRAERALSKRRSALKIKRLDAAFALQSKRLSSILPLDGYVENNSNESAWRPELPPMWPGADALTLQRFPRRKHDA